MSDEMDLDEYTALNSMPQSDDCEIIVRRIRLQMQWGPFFGDELPPVSVRDKIFIKGSDYSLNKFLLLQQENDTFTLLNQSVKLT